MKILTILLQWLPLAVLSTVMCFLIYGAVQQNYRQSANDPQIQIAEDMADTLQNNQDVELRVGNRRINIEKSLSSFLMVFNADGKLLATNAELDNKTPSLPTGVLKNIQKHNREIFTWEPKKGVRIAAVGIKYQGKHSGVVISGRNLREVEKREDRLFFMTGVVWVFSMFATLAAVTLSQLLKKK
jgi:hypothetical protein